MNGSTLDLFHKRGTNMSDGSLMHKRYRPELNNLPVFTAGSNPTADIAQAIEDVRRSDKPVTPATSQMPRLLPVDWLGIPLEKTTLPDFLSVSRLHFKDPRSQLMPKLHIDESLVGGKFKNYKQYSSAKWIPPRNVIKDAKTGFYRKTGQMKEILIHPQTSMWHVSHTLLKHIRHIDPVEYLNLMDPHNVITVEKGTYQWLIRDQADIEVGTNVLLSKCDSGFSNNRLPYTVDDENRDFTSLYKTSFCIGTRPNTTEGMSYPSCKHYSYPGYSGGSSMQDTSSSFLRFTKSYNKRDYLSAGKGCRAKSARPTFHNLN